MMRRNHVFICPSALSPGFRNWVEMTRDMQQEGVGLVLLPRPASLVRSPVLPCVCVCARTRTRTRANCQCAMGDDFLHSQSVLVRIQCSTVARGS